MVFDFEEEVSFGGETVGLREGLVLGFFGSKSLEAAGSIRRTAMR